MSYFLFSGISPIVHYIYKMSNKFVFETKRFLSSFLELIYCVVYLTLELIQYQYLCVCFLAILIAKGLRELPGGVARMIVAV